MADLDEYFNRNIHYEKLIYRGRTCELFARAIEEYYSLKTNNTHWLEVHKDWDYYVDFNEFKKTIYPVVEDYLNYIRRTEK